MKMDRFCPVTTKMNMGKNKCRNRLASAFLQVVPRLSLTTWPRGAQGIRSKWHVAFSYIFRKKYSGY